MSLSATLRDVGRPVAYYPRLARFLGSVNAAILFAQLHYWHDRGSDTELGVYKSSQELTEETGLSYREQATARAQLRAAGYLIETNRRLEHKVYFKLVPDAIDAAFDAWTESQSANDENAIRETTKAQPAKCGKRRPRTAESSFDELRKAQSGNKTETTHKTTTENKRTSTPTIPGVPEELVTEWKGVRKARRAGPISQTVIDAIHREAGKAGITAEEAIRYSVERGWQGFKADWFLKDQGQPMARPAGQPQAPAKYAGAAAAIYDGVEL